MLSKGFKVLLLFASIFFNYSSAENIFVKFGGGPTIINFKTNMWSDINGSTYIPEYVPGNWTTSFFQLNVGGIINDFLKMDGELCFRGHALLGNASYLANIYLQDNKISDRTFSPYIGVGVGLSHNTLLFIPLSTSFAFKAEAGLEIIAQENFSLNLAYRFFSEKYFLANEFGIGFDIKF
ncbi:MAG: hypothetical protein P4L22_03880 [Candidatus Babeliales bacterium]|nr:hypothetical protein [Candidatus Babeliales bacterium]